MIQAERAERIMQLYEQDYDNFLKGLKKKASDQAKKFGKKAPKVKKAEKNLKEAKEHKGNHLAQKAKDLLNKNGGIEGAKDTVQNVMKYFKDNTPSDYSVSVGGDTPKDDKAPEKTILGMPPIAVYAGGALVVILAAWGISIAMGKNKPGTVAKSTNSLQQAQ